MLSENDSLTVVGTLSQVLKLNIIMGGKTPNKPELKNTQDHQPVYFKRAKVTQTKTTWGPAAEQGRPEGTGHGGARHSDLDPRLEDGHPEPWWHLCVTQYYGSNGKALVSITELYLSKVLTFRGGGLKGTQDFCVLFLQLFDNTLRIKINCHKPKTDCPVAVLTKYPPDPVLNQPGQQTSVFVAIDWPESCSFLCWVWCRGIQEAFN